MSDVKAPESREVERLHEFLDASAQGLAILRSHDGDIDLLLTDVIMPFMNGKELFTRARELCPDLRVLYMSGYTEDVISSRGVLDESTDLLPKPFTSESLGRAVLRALGS